MKRERRGTDYDDPLRRIEAVVVGVRSSLQCSVNINGACGFLNREVAIAGSACVLKEIEDRYSLMRGQNDWPSSGGQLPPR